MARPSRYVDPDVYQTERIVPNAVRVATVPLQVGLIGVGDRTKNVRNELVQRGLVEEELLTFVDLSGTSTDTISAPSGGVQTLEDTAVNFLTGGAVAGARIVVSGDANPANNGTFTILDVPSATEIRYSNPAGGASSGPFNWSIIPFATLAERADRRLQNTEVLRNGVALSPNYLRFMNAYIQGTVTATVDISAPVSFCLEMDGQLPVTLNLIYAADDPLAPVLIGRQINVEATFSGTGGDAATIAQIAAAINTGLAAAGTLGYGATYSAVARDTGLGLLITSPVSTSSSNVEVFASIVGGTTLADIFGAAGANNRQARSRLEVSRLVFAAAAVYTASYIDIDSLEDELLNAGVQSISMVGSTAGIGTFVDGTDYLQDGDAVDWGGPGAPPDEPPVFTGSVAATYDLSTNDRIILDIDGRGQVEIDLNGLASPPLGYANPGTPATATAAEIATNINAVLGANAAYGPRYNAVASAVTIGASNYVRLTSPTEGQNGSVALNAPATLSATTAIFGLSTAQLPYTVIGTGKRPALASVYYVTYTINRPSSEYNAQRTFFSLDSARAELGDTSSTNPLMIAAELAFANGAPSIVTVQVNDATVLGSPTRAEFLAAMNATVKTDVITEMVVLSTDAAVRADFKDLLEQLNSQEVKRFRRGWFGLPRSTDIGDRDTPDSYVYIASRVLQVAPDSPARGRMILLAPPQYTGVSRDITLSDGSVQRVNLDTTFIAVAAAARRTSFSALATSLAEKSIVGFNLDDMEDVDLWNPTQRGLLASNGCMVLSFADGGFKVLDPVTTEAGGGGLVNFKYESTSPQKDVVTRKVNLALRRAVVGIVPTDEADFIIDIKSVIRSVIEGEIGSGSSIGPYTVGNVRGAARRPLNLSEDIEVLIDPDDPTTFSFRYWYNLRYPALRLFGEFTTDSPFRTV